MASKRHVRRKSCEHKVRHATADGAYAALRKLGEFHALNVYHCRWCGGYHIGHRPYVMQGDARA